MGCSSDNDDFYSTFMLFCSKDVNILSCAAIIHDLSLERIKELLQYHKSYWIKDQEVIVEYDTNTTKLEHDAVVEANLMDHIKPQSDD